MQTAISAVPSHAEKVNPTAARSEGAMNGGRLNKSSEAKVTFEMERQ
jgi:hypothetical protein